MSDIITTVIDNQQVIAVISPSPNNNIGGVSIGGVQGPAGLNITDINNITQQYSGNIQSQINNINNPSGVLSSLSFEQRIYTSIPSGIDKIYIPLSLTGFPLISANLEAIGNIKYLVTLQQVNSSGYFAMFSDTISETGLYLHTIAKIL